VAFLRNSDILYDVRGKSPEAGAGLLAGGEGGFDPPDTEHEGICGSRFRECGVYEERGSCEATERSVHHHRKTERSEAEERSVHHRKGDKRL
jgi:hypothetical protein